MSNTSTPSSGAPPSGEAPFDTSSVGLWVHPSSHPTRKTRPALHRRRQSGWCAGVCAGVAEHLGVSVWYVRLFFVSAPPVTLPVYLFLVLVLDTSDPRSEVPAARSRIARLQESARRDWSGRLNLPLVLLGTALALVVGVGLGMPRTFGVALLLAGAAVAWSQPAHESVAGSVTRIVVGAGLVTVGVLALLAGGEYGAQIVWAVGLVLAVFVALAFVLTPIVLRIVRDLGAERVARARESERADIAAHLHDSVMQSLSLIRSRAHEPDEVVRIARAQERSLRSWLYEDRPVEGTSVVAAARDAAAEVEDRHGAVIEVVAVGDTTPSEATAPMISAISEALTNAALHGRGSASLYLEASDIRLEAWVRDRGPGFDPEDVPRDRAGLRESILGRLRRAGGHAEVRSPLPGGGTEIHMSLPLTAAEAPRGTTSADHG
ncbi:MAG TPA: PspC domain-containing protein [Actinomycetaceae bacterium]|nr:PspC domain-containing protein [Actinomycetaceae bacterium]